jgi:hypothetical protein
MIKKATVLAVAILTASLLARPALAQSDSRGFFDRLLGGKPSDFPKQEHEAFVRCNFSAAKSFASQQGDPVSLGFAAYSTCGVEAAKLNMANRARLHSQGAADRLERSIKERQIGQNAALIVKLRSKATSPPARLPSDLPADETNVPASRPRPDLSDFDKELKAYLECTVRTSMLAAQRPEDPVSIASAAAAACKLEETKFHDAIARAHGQDWADWSMNRTKQRTLERNAAMISDIRSGKR